MEDLKPCPFCGGLQPEHRRGTVDIQHSCYVEKATVFYAKCSTCGCRSADCANEQAVTVSWNRRSKYR